MMIYPCLFQCSLYHNGARFYYTFSLISLFSRQSNSLWLPCLLFLFTQLLIPPSLVDILLDYSYLLISIGSLLLMLLLYVQIVFCWPFVHWYLILSITPRCSYYILSTIHLLKSFTISVVIPFNYLPLLISILSRL